MSPSRSDLREQLIQAAMTLLDQGGEFSLRSAARAAGVSAMAPYRHFADREALLGAVAERGFERLHAHMVEADRAPHAAAAILAQGIAYVDFALASPALFRLMFAGPKPGKLPGGETAYDVLSRRVAQLVPGQPAAAALVCWGAVHGIAMLTLDGRLDAPPQAHAAALALMVDGLASRQSPPAGSSSPAAES